MTDPDNTDERTIDVPMKNGKHRRIKFVMPELEPMEPLPPDKPSNGEPPGVMYYGTHGGFGFGGWGS